MTKEQFLGASLHTGLFCTANGFDKVHQLIGIFEDECRLSNSKEGYFSPYTKNVTPIARPLSDLTKPITHNGETFVPIDKINKSHKLLGLSEYRLFEKENKSCVLLFSSKVEGFNVLSALDDMRQLLEWHFNIMDELEPFIPVTEEFNPYK